ncbi:MAG TPA: lysylphosphatidylglycerol synthase transmembrane domain-containing protein [Anaerolineales bacterium]|nr:lysylphosphatidylglycerol synthase transmembrane domain-containing protein [Anaerolineales bacterium]
MTSTQTRKSGISSLWNLVKIVLALGLIVYVLSKSELANLVSTLQSASVFWLSVSGVLYFLLTLLKALQYSVLMRGKLTYPQVLNVTIWQNAISNFFLAGAGIAAYITMTRLEHEMKVSRSVTIFILTKVGDLIAIWLTLLVASNLVWSDIGTLQTPVIILLTGIGSVILFFFLTILFRQRFVAVLNRILEWLKISRIKFIENGMIYLQSLASMEQNKLLTTFGLLLVYSLIYLAVTIGCTYTNLAIFHLRLDVFAVIFVSVLIQLVSYFPVSVFGGLGITETSALYFWSFFDIPQDVMAPALIGIRVVFYLFNLIPLIYLPAYSVFIKPKEPTQNGQ